MRLLSVYLNKEIIILELDKLEMNKDERDNLLEMADEIAEYRFINEILKRLEEKDKQLFMEQLRKGSAEIFVEFLREKIENVETVLSRQSKVLEAEILDDIRSLSGVGND